MSESQFLEDKITIRWIQTFMMNHDLVLYLSRDNWLFLQEKQLKIEKEVQFHLGELKRGFESGQLNENQIENAGETHFVFNMDNGRTVGAC